MRCSEIESTISLTVGLSRVSGAWENAQDAQASATRIRCIECAYFTVLTTGKNVRRSRSYGTHRPARARERIARHPSKSEAPVRYAGFNVFRFGCRSEAVPEN